jgi:hypothetical protein
MRTRMVLVLLLTACGTAPGPVDAGGCGEGPSRTPLNLIENPGFECGENSDQWAAVFGSLELVNGGRTGRAAKVTVDALGGRFTYAKTFAPSPGNKTYCFSAWVAGSAPFMRMRVLRDFKGRVQEVAFAESMTSEYRRIPTLKVTADGAPALNLVFEVQTNRTDGQNAVAGQTMLIDDVDVWESMSNCGEAR